MMRAYHRWFGIVSALFMIFIAATGLGLQIDLWVTGNPVPGSENPVPTAGADAPDRTAVAEIAGSAIAAARDARPGMPIRHLEISFLQKGSRVTLGGLGPFEPHVTIDGGTGAVIPERPMTPGWHGWLQNLHAGYTFGPVGRIVSALMAVSLLLLGITGLLLYVNMFRRRARSGRRALFWKR